ncbi:nucleoside triphosphate pyrophosphohydrolase [Pedococcus soli]
MHEKRHRKLVRDRVPAIIRSKGEEAQTTVLAPAEFTPALLDKLVEESVELRMAPTRGQLDELADVWEVLTTVVTELGFTLDEVEQAASFKRIVRGGFSERVWLESTSEVQAVRN